MHYEFQSKAIDLMVMARLEQSDCHLSRKFLIPPPHPPPSMGHKSFFLLNHRTVSNNFIKKGRSSIFLAPNYEKFGSKKVLYHSISGYTFSQKISISS